MKKSVSRNYIYNLAYEVLTVLVPLVTTPYVSRVLGANNIGIYSYTNSIVTYFMLFAALGTTVYARREIAYQQDDVEKRSIAFWEIVSLRLLLTIICVGLYIPYCLKSDYPSISLVQSIFVVTVAFDITWFFQGMENFGVVVLRNSVVKILNIAFIFCFVRTSDDLIMYVLGLAVLPFLGNLVMWTQLKNHVAKPHFSQLHPKRHLKGTAILFLPTIASQVYLVLDKTMLGLFLDSKIESGLYEQSQKIIRICWTFVTTLSLVMAPRIAYVFAQNDTVKLKEYMTKSFSAVWFLSSSISFGLAAIATNLVPWFFGPGFEKVSTLLIVFSVIIFPIGLHGVIGSQYLVAIKKQSVYTISILVGAVVNFSLNLYVIPRYQATGAAVASVIAEVIIFLIQMFYVSFGLKTITIRMILGSSLRYLLSGIFMFAVVISLSRQIQPLWYNTMLLIFVGAVVYCGTLFVMKDSLVIEFVNKARTKYLDKGLKK